MKFFAAALAIALLVPESLLAQQSAVIRGRVVAAGQQPVPGARVTLLDHLGAPLAATITTSDGVFRLDAVGLGSYIVFAEAASQQSDARQVTVESSLPVDIELMVTPRVSESVIVQGTAAPAAGSRITASAETLQQLPLRLSSRGVQQLLATLPGFASEDNGLLHVRGADDGFLYVEDGVPVHDRVDALFGIARDPADVGSLNVLTGYVAPEFGLKSGAVIEVQSAATPVDMTLAAEATLGSDDLQAVRASGRGSRRGATFGASISAEQSLRFLDPVDPDNFHNRGRVFSGGSHLSTSSERIGLTRISLGAGQSRYDVPHGEIQEDAGQDQRQRLSQFSLSGSWQRSWSDTLMSNAALYARTIDAALVGSDFDTPLSANSDRRHRRLGFLIGLTNARGRHTLKAGFESSWLDVEEHFQFAVTDEDEAEEAEISDAAAAFTPDDPFRFDDQTARAQWSVYAQDRVRATDNLTLDFGVRWDRTNLLVAATQVSPRVGAAWRWPGRSTTVRTSVNRFFQPPQAEHLLLSSSAAARALSPFAEDSDEDGGADLPPERQTAFETGIEHWFGGAVRVDAAYWSRHVRNYADPNVFFGTTIIFPNSVASGTARGLDLRLEIPRYRGWSSYASYTLSKVQQVGPINGGLFLEDNLIDIGPGTEFTPDHDQRHVASAGVTYQHRRGFTASLAARYESGTPLEVDEHDLDELLERPGAELVDFDAGRVRARALVDLSASQSLYRRQRMRASVRFAILNALNRAYALNFGNPFSGTHFGAPRTIRLDLRIERLP